ncbi:type II toxin-antitoxin system Phd/YefM family antitoxin [Acidithiobacillus sp.]|uniref:type II toxin-antitoxin system Phd/YefM family antitoxin n=1 Tax=Acidithiobacillus sp. TaxID=1872118 RepID=UPI002611A733|nr:type II toxin-antitoxin system Phd/YefM family antitoxin [Acidithiobacillus sp.]MDD2751467.1 type II toxin-antitoxin system Phd/YefM family antitoxin [Acidithiobacillus sp.]MDD5280408.1 type II toxin-antitoxin system Phd/YefM family antitoxin [Acidithiobacillus sp.]
MKVYTFSEARQKFSTALDSAQLEGAVKITRRDGRAFLIRPVQKSLSPLDVKGVKLNLSRDEIVSAVREGREREARS